MKRWIIGTTLFLALSGTAILFSQSTGGKKKTKKSFDWWWKGIKTGAMPSPQDVIQAINQLIRENQQLRAKQQAMIGMVRAWPGLKKDIPKGWMVCDGRELEIQKYPKLYKVLGELYGKASKGKFRLPDYRGYFLRGLGGVDPDKNRMVGSVQKDAFRSHTHEMQKSGKHSHMFEDYTFSEGPGHNWGHKGPQDLDNKPQSPFRHSTETDGKHIHKILPKGGPETRPINRAVYWIIRVE